MNIPIEYTGDIFKATSQTIVNTVNTVGVMGKGIAKQYKELYPEMFIRYRELCMTNQFKVGQLWLYHSVDKQHVLNFPTKKHWKNNSQLDWIKQGLDNFRCTYKQRGIEKSITFPQLGCANGGLDYYQQVRPIMFEYLSGLDIDIKIVLYNSSSNYNPFASNSYVTHMTIH